jgi:hypothetical protein
MNRSRFITLLALNTLVVALLASTALAGAKAPEKKWEWDAPASDDPALLQP